MARSRNRIPKFPLTASPPASKSSVSGLEEQHGSYPSANAAWLVKHNLMQAMLERDAGRKLRSEVQVDDAYLDGEHPSGKRRRGSQNKTPFVAAVQVSEGGQPVVLKLAVIEGFRKAAVQRWAEENVQAGTRMHTDRLGCFRGFATAGCEHAPQVTGGGPGGCEKPGLGNLSAPSTAPTTGWTRSTRRAT